MKLTINGEQSSTTSATLAELLVEYDFKLDQGGFAVAVNDALVTRQQFEDYQLSEEDNIEIIRATQGG
jgi:sulfur carrier protein